MESYDSEMKKNDTNNIPWCIAPFIGLLHTFNMTAPCCEYTVINKDYHRKAESPENFFNSEGFRNLRKSFMNYDYNSLPQSCKVCLNSPTSHSKFYTEPGHENFIDNYLKNKHKFNEEGYITKYPLTFLQIMISNKCNASCRMCKPIVSSTRLKSLEKLGLVSHTTHPELELSFDGTVVDSDIEQCVELINFHSDTLREVVVSGGDPSQAENLPILLDTLLVYKDNINLHFLSNGTFDKLSNGQLIWDILKQFDKITVTFSMDSIPEINDYIRIGINSKRLLKLALECKEHLKSNPNSSVNIHCTLTNYGIYYFTDFLDWIEKNVMQHGITFTMNCVNQPRYQTPHNLPHELRKKTLKKLHEYKTYNEYFKLLIKAAKKALFQYPFSTSEWNTCLWLDKKQDSITGMSFPLFEPYQKNILEVTDWDQNNLYNKNLFDGNHICQT